MQEQTRFRLSEYLKIAKLSQNAFAKKLGVSGAQLNQYMNDKYIGDVESLEQRIEAYIDRVSEKESLTGRFEINYAFVSTPSAQKMLETIKYAHIEEEINVIIGDAGLGKSCVLQEYAKENREVILIESTPAMSVKALLINISKQLGLEDKGASSLLFGRIRAKLKDTGRLLLIDEAENLSIKCLEILRRLHDFTQVGIVLAGTPVLRNNIMGRKKELKQLYSRVGLLCDIGSTLKDVEIEQLASSYLNTSALNKVFVKLSKGSPRRMRKLIKNSLRAAKINNSELSSDIVEKINGLLIS